MVIKFNFKQICENICFILLISIRDCNNSEKRIIKLLDLLSEMLVSNNNDL